MITERTSGPQPARIGAAFGAVRQPVHVAMRAGIEEIAEMPGGLRDRIRLGDADAVETERAGLLGERGPDGVDVWILHVQHLSIEGQYFSSWPGMAARRTASLPLAYVPAMTARIQKSRST